MTKRCEEVIDFLGFFEERQEFFGAEAGLIERGLVGGVALVEGFFAQLGKGVFGGALE